MSETKPNHAAELFKYVSSELDRFVDKATNLHDNRESWGEVGATDYKRAPVEEETAEDLEKRLASAIDILHYWHNGLWVVPEWLGEAIYCLHQLGYLNGKRSRDGFSVTVGDFKLVLSVFDYESDYVLAGMMEQMEQGLTPVPRHVIVPDFYKKLEQKKFNTYSVKVWDKLAELKTKACNQ
jgi:hypothetical protein